MNRITEWRHRTGRSKTYRPKSGINYKGVAISISHKWFKDLWQYREDLLQEIDLLVYEAIEKKRIRGIRKFYGNGVDRLGIVLFSRATQARLYQVRRNYGLYRNKTFYSYEEMKNEKNNME